jgi:hypothetical protein
MEAEGKWGKRFGYTGYALATIVTSGAPVHLRAVLQLSASPLRGHLLP